ncbi:MAG: hypothetical protein IKO74_04365, partial [Selenomonadaceae bacterium]|nr:hypothetical protein [Selenomonadaceae bacterium]
MNSTIDAGAGDDFISGDSNSKIDGGDGNDSIYTGSNSTIDGGAGSDSIYNSETNDNVSIDAGADDDYIRNDGSNASLLGGAGDDTIWNNGGSNVYMLGGEGNDSIISNKKEMYDNTGENITIEGGKGDDYLSSYNNEGTLFIYNEGDGNDTIDYGYYGGNATLRIGDGTGTYSTVQSGKVDMIIIVGDGSILTDEACKIEGVYKDLRYITLTEGDDTYSNSLEGVTINALGGNDSITNTGASVSIDAGAGDDLIIIDDNGANNSTILTGAGNDTISLGDSATNILIEYTEGDGSDLIQGFNGTSTLKIGDGLNDTFSKEIVGSNILINVGDGVITLVGTASLASVNIQGEEKDKMSVTPTEGNDSLNNSLEGAIIEALGGDDTIENSGDNVTISGGEGDDSISNYGANVSINGNAGNDNILNSNDASGTTILGGADDDTITNYAANVSIDGGAGNDSVLNGGSDVTIDGGDGGDTIHNYEEAVRLSISGGAGNDSISNYGESITIDTGAGNDTVFNYGASTSIIGEAGNDFIVNEGTNIFISGGDDKDTISNNGDNVTIDAGDDIDVITNNGSSVSINGGAGNDFINNGEALDGESDANPDNVTIFGGAGNDNIVNNIGANLSINGGEGADTVENYGSNSTVEGGADNDYLINLSDSVSIDGGAGNDTISNYDGSGGTLLGGEGNDYIENYGVNSLIDGGAGIDTIINYGTGNSILGGAGNDSISNNSSLVTFLYSSGDGNDLIKGFNETSTLSISGGTYSTAESGSDVIVTVGEDSIVLQDAASLASVNIVGELAQPTLITGTEGNDTITNTQDFATIQALGGNDYIVNSGKNVSIEAGSGVNTILNTGENSTVNGGTGRDYIDNRGGASYSSLNGGTGKDTLTTDGSTEYVTIEGGSGNDEISSHYSNHVTINGGLDDDQIGIEFVGTLEGGDLEQVVDIVYAEGDGNDTIGINSNGGTQATVNLNITSGTYTTLESDEDIIINVGEGSMRFTGLENVSFNISGTEGTTLNGTSRNDSLRNFKQSGNDITVIYSAVYGHGGDDTIDAYEEGVGTSLFGGAGNDSIYSRLVNATITGGAGNDTLVNEGDTNSVLYLYNSEDEDDIITGFNANSTLKIESGTIDSVNAIGSDLVLTVQDYSSGKNGSVTLKDITGLSKITVIDANGNEVDYSTPVGTEGADSLNNIRDNVTIAALGGNDTIYNYGSNVSINGGTDNNYIYNDSLASSVTIDTGDGTDTIDNYGSTVTINTSAGNDVIYNGETADSVSIDAGAGDDNIINKSVVYFDSGTGTYISISPDNVTISGGAGEDFIGNYGGSNVSILGGTGNDSIYNSNTSPDGELLCLPDNVTIEAGTGDDLIQNYSGTNVKFLYSSGDGNDSIKGFNETSTLQIGDGTGTYSSQTSGNDIILTVGEGKIFLQDAASINNLNIIGSGRADTFIPNSENNVTITGTDNAEKFDNKGFYVTIQALGGNDTIINSSGSNNSIDGGAGDDIILINDAGSQNSTILGGAGNDEIYNRVSDSLTIDGGAGDDLIDNGGDYVTFLYSSGDGNDTISGFNDTSSLQIGDGTGNYSIQTNGSDIIVTVGEGSITLKDLVSLNNINIIGTSDTGDSLFGTEGNDRIDICDYFNTSTDPYTLPYSAFFGLGGNDTFRNIWGTGEGYPSNLTLDGGEGNDRFTNLGSNVLISGGDGDDTLYHEQGTLTTLNGDAGDDQISNSGDSVSIGGGDGADIVLNYASFVMIDGGADNDYIDNRGKNTSILGGNGNDSISNNDTSWNSETQTWEELDNVTINAGAGNDSINNKGANVTFLYSSGDGNDTIVGFNATSSLQIGGGTGTYSTQVSNKDVIVTVGNGKITLQGAASLSAVNINDNAHTFWTLDGTTATYGDKVTVSGVTSIDGLSIDGTTVTVSEKSLNKNNEVTISDGYTLALDSNATKATASSKATYDKDTQTYTTAGVSKAGYRISSDGKSISYVNADALTFEFSGLTNNATAAYFNVDEENKKIGIAKKITPNDGTVITMTPSDSDYTLDYGKTMTVAESSSKATYDKDTQTYTTAGVTKAGYRISSDGKSISYVNADALTFKFSGLTNAKTGANYFTVDEEAKTIAVSRFNVDTTNSTPVVLDTAPDGYTLTYGNKMSTIAGGDDQWGTLSNGTVSYETDRVFAHYELNDDKTTLTYV